MTKKTLQYNDEKLLRRKAGDGNAESYAAWLRREKANKKQKPASTTEPDAPLTLDGGLGDDGYAAYLRRAAKEARKERTAAVEEAHYTEGQDALRGYAAYLAEQRKQAGDELITAANDLLGNYHKEGEAEAALASVTEDAARLRLTRLYRDRAEGATEFSDKRRAEMKALIERLAGYPRKRAYDYCRLLGYTEKTAKQVADYIEATRSENDKALEALLGTLDE